MSQSEQTGKLMDLKETAALLGVSVCTVRRWCKARSISSFRLGKKKIVISSNEASRFLQENERPRLQKVA